MQALKRNKHEEKNYLRIATDSFNGIMNTQDNKPTLNSSFGHLVSSMLDKLDKEDSEDAIFKITAILQESVLNSRIKHHTQ